MVQTAFYVVSLHVGFEGILSAATLYVHLDCHPSYDLLFSAKTKANSPQAELHQVNQHVLNGLHCLDKYSIETSKLQKTCGPAVEPIDDFDCVLNQFIF